ncbi:MAG: hypothetical protein QG653_258 [Patescibacteria group bacterium]|nr:hypothetical protein [Patescibacteria group bacterium]
MAIVFPKETLTCDDLSRAIVKKTLEEGRIGDAPSMFRRRALVRWRKLFREYAKKHGWQVIYYHRQQKIPTFDGFGWSGFEGNTPVRKPVLWIFIPRGYYLIKNGCELHQVIPNIKGFR